MTHKLTTFNDLKVGQKASLTKTITEEDLNHFIAITGDKNPLHVDDTFAEQTFLGQRIAHGMLSTSLFSTLVGIPAGIQKPGRRLRWCRRNCLILNVGRNYGSGWTNDDS